MMKAIVVGDPGQASVENVVEPDVRPTYVKVRVRAIALNPADWKHIDRLSDKGARVGADLAGFVEEVGVQVKTSIKKGDRVCGFCHGGNNSNHEDGAFGQYCVIKDGFFMQIPNELSFEDATTLPCGVGTVGQGMYQSLGLPLPTMPQAIKPAFPILIHGGSTATGTLACQFAVLSGLTVIATASPRNHRLLESLGAQICFDYNDPDCAQKIREHTGNKLRHVFDTISTQESVMLCCGALASSAEEGELFYNALFDIDPLPRRDIRFRWTMLYIALGEEYVKFGRKQEAIPEDYEFISRWYSLSQTYIFQGRIKPHPKLVGHGFESALEGLDTMRKGELSARKLVYSIE